MNDASGILTRSLIIAAFAPLGTGAAFAAGFTVSSNSTIAQTLSSGTGTVNAGATLSVSGDADAVLVTGTSSIVNNGTIQQTQNAGSSSRGIRVNTANVALTLTNGGSTNSAALVQAEDADAIQVNKASDSVTLYNYGTFNSINHSAGGAQAIDWNAITSGANTLYNYSTGVLTASEADAVRPGVNGFVYNDGLIKSVTTTGSSSDGIDAQTNSGITVVNAASAGAGTGTGVIEGARHGITGGNTAGTGAYVMSITNNLGGTIQGDNGSGINIDGINANEFVALVNHGTITGNGHNIGDGNGHDGDGVDVDGLVKLTNTGTIRSLNAYAASGVEFSEGVTVGGGTILNSGTIEGSVAAGNTTALGRGITIAGVDKDSNGNSIPAQAPYAATAITNSGLIKGDTDSAIIFSSALASGFSHTITNQAGGLIQTGSATASAILTAADAVTINNSGTIDGSSSGKAITAGSGNLTLNIVGGAAGVLGDINGGTGTAKAMTIDPGTGNSFSYSGSISNFNTVETRSGTVSLSGINTYAGTTRVTGGTLVLEGANRLSSASALQLNGGTLSLANAGGANGQTFASLALTANSTIDLGLSSLSFNALGTVGSGSALTIVDWSAGTSPNYAFRLSGDDSKNASFLQLVDGTTIDGLQATYQFDGTYTDVRPVPLPGAGVMLISGLGLLGAAGRRRKYVPSA